VAPFLQNSFPEEKDFMKKATHTISYGLLIGATLLSLAAQAQEVKNKATLDANALLSKPLTIPAGMKTLYIARKGHYQKDHKPWWVDDRCRLEMKDVDVLSNRILEPKDLRVQQVYQGSETTAQEFDDEERKMLNQRAVTVITFEGSKISKMVCWHDGSITSANIEQIKNALGDALNVNAFKTRKVSPDEEPVPAVAVTTQNPAQKPMRSIAVQGAAVSTTTGLGKSGQ
jgi:hypothetical protein